MKKPSIKIVLLVLLIIFPIGLKISKEPLLNRVEKDGYRKQPKDSLWEYVKYEVEKGSINQKIKYGEKFQESILLNVENATVKDSLAVHALLQELKVIFPLKRILYFEDYVKEVQKYFNSRYIISLNNKKATSLTTGRSYNEIVKTWLNV